MSTPTELQAQLDVLTCAVVALLANVSEERRQGVRDSVIESLLGLQQRSDDADAAQARVLRQLLPALAPVVTP